MEQPCPLRESVLACAGHALVIGGPGSGKTTIALRKAARRIREGLHPGQSTLFLSFSRAAVARIAEAAQIESTPAERDLLSIQTFHSFFWELLKTHGYLLGAPRKLSVLLPHDERALNGGIDDEDEGWDAWLVERDRLFREEGRVAFDLFAPCAAKILAMSSHLLISVARRHPLVIVDEAQDTGQSAWDCVQLLAAHTQIVCLADLDQQIFDFLPGVGPERVQAIRAVLTPHEVDLGTQNHRSPDSEILAFGNDILAATPRGSAYRGVSSIAYRPEKPPPNWNHLLRRGIGAVMRAIRETEGGKIETIAILVGNNRSALRMSNALNAVGIANGKPVRHKLLFDEAEALLCARLAAFMLEPKRPAESELDVATCMELIADAKRSTGKGRKGVAKLLEQAGKIRAGKPLKINIADALRSALAALHGSGFRGDPAEDWLAVKRALRESGQSELEAVASNLDFLVAFRRGHRISGALSAEWLRDGAYTMARKALDSALAQEQIVDGAQPVRGLQVMTFHKAKGKQFDGVIIVRESMRSDAGARSSFIWRGDAAPHPKSRKVLRVGVTRARSHVLLLDPFWPNCPILEGHRL